MMKVKRWILVGLMVLVLMGGLIGCNKTADIQEERTLQIGLMPDIGMFPLLVAEEEGYFEDEQLDVELLVFKSAKDRDTALQSGQLNGTMSDLLAVYFLNSSEIKVKATSITESRFLLLGSQNSGITGLIELENMEIGLSVNTVIEYFVDSVLSDRGIKAKNISVPQIPVRMELLRSGQMVAASLPDPLATVLTKSGASILADSREMKIDPAVLIFTDKTINEQGDVLADLYRAYDKAVEAINKTPEKYRQLLLTKGGFPETVIDDIVIPHFRKAELPSRDELDRILRWAENKGLKKADLGYDDLVYEDLFD